MEQFASVSDEDMAPSCPCGISQTGHGFCPYRIEKVMPTGNSYETHNGIIHKPSAGISMYNNLHNLLKDVDDSEGNAYFQMPENQTAAEANLAEDVAAWEKTVEAFIGRTLNKRKPVVMLTQTPFVLSLLGANKDMKVSCCAKFWMINTSCRLSC